MMSADGYELDWLDLVLFYGYQFVPIKEKTGFLSLADQSEDRRIKRVNKALRVLKPSQAVEVSLREFALLVSGYFHQLPKHRKGFISDPLWTALSRFNLVKPNDLMSLTNSFFRTNDATLEIKTSADGSPVLGLSENILNNIMIQPFMQFTTEEPYWLFLCERCGLPYRAARSDSTYCGATCRSGARRERQR